MPTNSFPRTARLPQSPALRLRAEFPPLRRPKLPRPPAHEATHDFLVPNPRPDLTFDPHTLRMLSVD